MNKKKEASLLRLVVVLTLIALVAGLSLTGVYALTKEPIDQAANAKKMEALNQVLPNFKGTLVDTTILLEGDSDPLTVHVALQEDGKLFGAAIESYTKKAYNGRFDIMVGFDAAGTIINSEVLKASETPGLGEKIDKNKSDFAKQFSGQDPTTFKLLVTKDHGDVEAITAATISSRAYCDAMQRAYDCFLKVKEVYHE